METELTRAHDGPGLGTYEALNGRRVFAPGRMSVGFGISDLFSPRVVPLLAGLGVDYVFIDMEHSRFTMQEVSMMVWGGRGSGVPVIVRPPEISREWISRLVDIGIDGIFAPRVATAADARAAVRYAKYPPLGDRGDDGRISGAYPRSREAQSYANDNTVVVVIVESREGAENIDEICQTPGVDAVSVGPADLTMSLGIPGERESEEYRAVESRIVDACARHGMPLTIGTAPSVAEAAAHRDRGCFSVFMDDEIGVISGTVASYVSQVQALSTTAGDRGRSGQQGERAGPAASEG